MARFVHLQRITHTSILSDLFKTYEQKKAPKIIEQIKRLSPVAWQHINLVVKFEFFANQKNIDLSGITEDLVKKFEN